MSDLISPIPEGHKRGWKVLVNGQVIEDVELVQIISQYGEFRYGLKPEGYDGLGFHEIGGGGSVIIPYSVVEEDLVVGIVQQSRPNQGGLVWNVPRGFITPGETHFNAAIRETAEETGYRPPEERVKIPQGEPCNPNSAFFETTGFTEGVHFYTLYIYPTEVEKVSGGEKPLPSSIFPYRPVYKFKKLYTADRRCCITSTNNEVWYHGSI